MPLLTDDNYPEVLRFLRMLDIELRDEKGCRYLPDMVALFETHFEKSEETYNYVVSYCFDFILVIFWNLGHSFVVGTAGTILLKSFNDGFHQ